MSHDRTLLVVVLYRPEGVPGAVESQTLRCLERAFASQPALAQRYDVLLWDNSPSPASKIPLQVPFQYRHATTNDGVAGAYNGALAICVQNGYTWLLLLDDDTEVSAEYFAGMLLHRDLCDDDARIAAIAPLLYDHAFQLSPQQVFRYRHAPVAPGLPRILEAPSFAANSGVIMRACALIAIGGYSLDFWLDYSDIYVFHQLYAAGKCLFLAADLRLQHSMTMLDYDGRMSAARYTNFLYAEQAFFDLFKTPAQQAVQQLRLLARVFRQRRYRNKQFSRQTWNFLLYRLTTSKVRRLAIWHERKAARHAGKSSAQAGGA